MDLDLLTQYIEDRPAEEQYQIMRTLLANLTEGFIVSDATGKFILWNKKATDILGKSALDVADPSKWPAYYGCYEEDMTTPIPANELPLTLALQGQVIDNKVIFIKNDVREAWILVSAVPVRLMDQTGGMVFFRDITRIKKREEEAKQIVCDLRKIKEQQLETLQRI